ncbi:hypothetical protein MGG_16100 [Pyricularia oryzae 70-15]|uniref:Uncharacterized protein n=1 Tax=Pyricularia oryzae (strain 70-15 / ATCC MYA-4617 / FGSC 8958) TaxID=242507 RepID=G4MQJ8_PYRO7|nr:uncharacterized protein MGG_16100 [Pyricularia oryzae 70-15]EHA56488.1 hypothetical protein MGG_16100 [Pyricularia oryzae 70-15]
MGGRNDGKRNQDYRLHYGVENLEKSEKELLNVFPSYTRSQDWVHEFESKDINNPVRMPSGYKRNEDKDRGENQRNVTEKSEF